MNSLAFFLSDLQQPLCIKAMIPFQHNLDNAHSFPYHLMSLLKQHHVLHPIEERVTWLDMVSEQVLRASLGEGEFEHK